MTTSAQNRVPSFRTRQPSSSTRPSSGPPRATPAALPRAESSGGRRRDVLADDLFRQIPLYQLGARVPGRDATRGVEQEDGVVLDAGDEQLEPPLVLGSAPAVGAHAMALWSELSARRTPRSCGRSNGLRRIGTSLAEPLAVDAVSGGDDGDRYRRQRRIEFALLEKSIAVHDRHHQIEQDDRGSDLHAADRGQRFQAIAGGPDVEAGLGQGFGKDLPDIDVIVDNKTRICERHGRPKGVRKRKYFPESCAGATAKSVLRSSRI